MTTKNKVVILSFLILIFLIITVLVVNKNIFLIDLDAAVKTFITNYQSISISNLMFSITKIGNIYEAFIIFLVFGLFLVLKNKKYFYTFILASAFGVTLSWIIKLLTKIQRPSLILEQDYSFPSTHATMAIIFLLSSIYLLVPIIKNNLSKKIFLLITSVIFPLVAFSRIYLSVHWLSDVTAGILLGLICFLFAEIICCDKRENVL